MIFKHASFKDLTKAETSKHTMLVFFSTDGSKKTRQERMSHIFIKMALLQCSGHNARPYLGDGPELLYIFLPSKRRKSVWRQPPEELQSGERPQSTGLMLLHPFGSLAGRYHTALALVWFRGSCQGYRRKALTIRNDLLAHPPLSPLAWEM